MKVRWLKVLLVCDERATFPQGTDPRTEVHRVHQQTVFRRRKFDINRDAPFEADFTVTVPAGAMHSFISPHNRVEWSLVVRGRVARWPIFERTFPLYVYPRRNTDHDAQRPPHRQEALV